MRSPLCLAATGLLLLGAAACRGGTTPETVLSTDAPSRSGLLSTPGGLVVGNEAGRLIFWAADGGTGWSVQHRREFSVRPVLLGGLLLAAAADGEWLAVDLASGKETWRLSGRPAPTLALLADGERAFAAHAQGVYAVEGQSGKKDWERVTEPPAALALAQGAVVFASDAGVTALAPATGLPLWKVPLPGARGLFAEAARVYVAAAGGEVGSLDAESGEVLWRAELKAGVVGGPWLARGQLWVATASPGLVALSPQDGTVLFRTQVAAPVLAGVVEVEGLMAVPMSNLSGELWLLQPPSPQPVERWRAHTPLRTPPVVMGDKLYACGLDGRVLAFTIRRRAGP